MSEHVPISVNIITKGDPKPLFACVESVIEVLGDTIELVVVDTGSSKRQLEKLKTGLLGLEIETKLLSRPNLSVNYKPFIKKFLGDEQYLKEFKDHTKSPKGILSFCEAREIARKASKHDVIFWIDTDDFLVEPEPGILRKHIDHIFGEGKLECVFLDYDYAFGPDGVCTTTQRRERFFLKDKYSWKGNCHETAIPDEFVPGTVGYHPEMGARIQHTNGRKPSRVSDIRNFIILMNEAEEATKNGEEVDPRTVYYLGNAARGLDLFKQARRFYDQFDFLSGSEDDRFGAAYFSAFMCLNEKVMRPVSAIDYFFKCIQIKPLDPRGYFGLCRAYAILERHKEALVWYEVGNGIPLPSDQVHSYDPTHINYAPHVVAAHCFREMKNPEGAMRCITQAYQSRPHLKDAQEMYQMFENWATGENLATSVQNTLANIQNGGAPNVKRVGRALFDDLIAIPPTLEEMGLGRIEGADPRAKKPEIAFMCPGQQDKWAASTRERGIGGSEKMVIILAEALQRTGRVNASVYANVPIEARGVHDTGVMWRHFSEFDEERFRDVMVYWRCPRMVHQLTCPAGFRVAWNHDVVRPDDWTPDVVACYDKIQVQSEFHAKPLREAGIPEDKIWVARNAVEDPQDLGKLERDPKQVVYCSSWDRGLLTVCEVVKRAQKIDPEICLVVSYGITKWCRRMWAVNNHRGLPDVGRDIAVDLYERMVYDALDDVNATILHQINFTQMEALMRSSGVWFYPTRFPEISCMSAMEAQLHGCVPLSTRFGALSETVLPQARVLTDSLPDLPEGGPISEEILDDCAKLLVEACSVDATHEGRLDLAIAAHEKYNVDSLAKIWLDVLGVGSSVAPTNGSVLPDEPSNSSKKGKTECLPHAKLAASPMTPGSV